jgi:HAE1 family hydrophobic/amphiphilic exporter-1
MNVSEIFIKRPIATSLIMLGIAMFGVVAYRALPVSDLPQVEFPSVSVSAGLPGADPGTMASAVASPLERQFTTIAGLDSMVSSSGLGYTNVQLIFDLARNIDSAAVDVQTAIAAVMPLLPAGMPAPPGFRKYNPNNQPIMRLSLASKTASPAMLDDFAENLVASRLSMLSGVSQVQVNGGARFAVRVQIDPDKLKAEQIGINEINAALQNWNVNLPTGQLYGANATYNLKANGQLNHAEEFANIIVTYRRGVPVRLGQVARVLDDVQDQRAMDFYYTKAEPKQRQIGMNIFRQPDANTIVVSDAIRALIPELTRELPTSIHLLLRNDRAATIRTAFQDVRTTMMITLVLVIGVIYLFLHSLRATIIPALALPFSLLGTFAAMQLLGFSLNNLSMLAIILCIGFVVDDAIVMLENIVRHMEAGEAAFEAALKGSKEIGFTILTMTVSLAAVFIPILFMTGVLGRMFREFAVTIVVAILISGLVSISLTPMLCSRLLSTTTLHAKRGVAALLERGFDAVFRGYRWSLGLVLQHRPIMVGVFVAVVALTLHMFSIVKTGFIPDTDNDTANVGMVAQQGTAFDDMNKWVHQVATIINENPYIIGFGASPQTGGAGFSNHGNFGLNLVPRAQRPFSAAEVLNQIRPRINGFPNFRTFSFLPPSLMIGGRLGNQTYSVLMQSLNVDELFQWAPTLEAAMTDIPEIMEVSTDVEMKSPRVNLSIDREKAAALGLNVSLIENALGSSFSSLWASTIYGDKTQYQVILEIDPKYQTNTDSFRKITFKTGSGALVPLDAVVRAKPGVGPQTINHTGQLPSVSVSFGLRPGVSSVKQPPRSKPPQSESCRRQLRRVLKDPQNCSRIPCATCPCCSLSPSGSSTSSWAPSTRVTFTRSQSWRGCHRPGLGRWSRCGCSMMS